MKKSNKLTTENWREAIQELSPKQKESSTKGEYDLYPAFELESGVIDRGFTAIADKIKDYKQVAIDGYVGVLWKEFRGQLDESLRLNGIRAEWIDVSEAMLESEDIRRLVEPFLGGSDPIFGTRFDGELIDFFDRDKLKALNQKGQSGADITIFYGCGAALADSEAPIVYVDLPKNELQYRSKAQSVTNLGKDAPEDPKTMYKRFYFVDWVALNRHKKEILSEIDWIVDEQHPDEPAIMQADDFREALETMSKNYFRVRPWFEPGPWGGQWCKEHIPGLPQDAVNLAWSFELIAPENGLMFCSDKNLLETSFDWLMYQDKEAVVGDSADQFGYEFPIRFDFLDTVEGGNLSVQCHPKTSFIREEFGESFTQDETYYILDCKSDSEVYLGFREDIDATEFRTKLEQSVESQQPVEIKDYVQTFPSHKHDLFLIPNQTIHCSGQGNLVLEISATPYIFTFKMYDWLRLDLNGEPRDLNIERAFKNLNFERKGKKVEKDLISEPYVMEENGQSRVVHLPTHQAHFYDVHRFEFEDNIEAETDGSCHVMSLVEGSSIILETKDGLKTRFNYAETFVVPAAAESYTLINEGDGEAKVVKAFVKKGIELPENG